MSDNWIIIIPESVDFIPTEEAQKRAVELFSRLAPNADEVKASTTADVEFIWCGGNFERVICPACGKELDTDWWVDCMDEEAKVHFPLEQLEMPCCRAKLSLNELKYEWPQGFARFSVEVMNPKIRGLSEEDMEEFEHLLGCKVRKILRHI